MTSSETPDLEQPAKRDIWTPQWYALYTRSRFEKKMLSELTDSNVEVFLPMREVLSRWKDRKKRIWIPLFPGYIFVNHVDTPENRYKILNVPGAVRFVSIEGHAEPIPEEQIQSVRKVYQVVVYDLYKSRICKEIVFIIDLLVFWVYLAIYLQQMKLQMMTGHHLLGEPSIGCTLDLFRII